METKKCKCCGRELPLSDFSTNGLFELRTCQECVNKKRKETRATKNELEALRKQVAQMKQTSLTDYTPRELMIELKRRGYEFTMTYTEVRTINSNNL